MREGGDSRLDSSGHELLRAYSHGHTACSTPSGIWRVRYTREGRRSG